MRYATLFAVLLTASGGAMAADSVWVQFSSDEPAEVEIDIAQARMTDLDVEFVIPGVQLDLISRTEGSFTRVTVPGMGRIGEPGAPQLPVLRRFVELPVGADPVLVLDVLATEVVDLGKLGLPATILPAQHPRPKCDCEEYRNWRFVYNDKAYRERVEYPTVVLSAPFGMRNHDFVMATVAVTDASSAAVEGALVGATQDGVLLGAGYIDSNGDAIFHIDAPAAGINLDVRVTAHNFLPTDASVMVGADADGIVTLDKGVYTADETVTIDVFDDNAGLPLGVTLETSPSNIVPVTMSDAGDVAGHFVGSVQLGVDLVVAHNDVLTVKYLDADTGSGTNVTKTDTATVDAAGPVITNTRIEDLGPISVNVLWDTDEASDSLVTYGRADSPPPTDTVFDAANVTAHGRELTGLSECTDYIFWVRSVDPYGHSTTDDNLGAYYTFATPKKSDLDFDSTDTPITISDSSTFSSTINVPLSKTVFDVNVQIDITHTYDGDLDIYLISPLGARVELTTDNGSSGANFTGTIFDDEASTSITSGSAPFAGSYQPETPLSAVDDENSLGDWQLEVTDDAGGDTGSLNWWKLTLVFPDQGCGPEASYSSHALVSDTCSESGIGDGDGIWDAGDDVQFSMVIGNSGTDPLTNVNVMVTPVTAGVLMLKASADFGDLPVSGTIPSIAPHFTVRLPLDVVCGQLVVFKILISSDQGSFQDNFSQIVGQVIPGGGTAFSEDFEGGAIPGDWAVVDGLSDGFTWFADSAADPQGCANTDPAAPLSGTWAAVDSDCASTVDMDEQLISPQVDLAAGDTASLEFDHYFNRFGVEIADVDVRSSLTGGEWVNVASYTASTSNPAHATIDISAEAAGASDVQVRWHYYDANFDWYWYVDNVVITYTATGDCNMSSCGEPNTPPLVTITAPADPSSFEQGAMVDFTGTATDAEDGDLSVNLIWTSDLDGEIGTGGSFSTSSLGVGSHVITAAVTDSGSLPGQDTVGVTITAAGLIFADGFETGDCGFWSLEVP